MRRGSCVVIALVLAALALPTGASARDVRLGFAMPGDMIDMTPDQGGDPTASAFRAVAPSAAIVRAGLPWKDVQPDCAAIAAHQYDWASTDDLIELYLDEGVRPLLTLASVPACAAVDHDPALEPRRRYLDDFATFAMKVVERYGLGGTFFDLHPELAGACCRLTYVEVWNEPNLKKKWSRASPEAYARVFVRVARRIHDASNWSPDIHVITGGVTGLNGGDWEGNGRSYVRGLVRSRALRHLADAIGIHTYSPTAKHALENAKVVRRILNRHGYSGPIDITEHGWSTCPSPGHPRANGKCVTRRGQAHRMDLLVTRLTAPRNRRLDVRMFLWFMAQDEATRQSVADCPGSPKNFYGLWDHSGDPKPSRSVWEQLTGVALPATTPPAPQLHGCSGRWE